jgi:plasmid stability protein
MESQTLTIRRFDPALKRKLRLRAAKNGHSMEEEVREILKAALSTARGPSFLETFRKRAAAAGYVTLKLPAREPMRDPPDFK